MNNKDKYKSGSSSNRLRNDKTALWTIRALLRTEAYESRLMGPNTARLWEEAGLVDLSDEPKIDTEIVETHLMERIAELENDSLSRDEILFENVDRLGRIIDLNAVERELLSFGITVYTDTILTSCFRKISDYSNRQVIELLSHVLDNEMDDVDAALGETGTLSSTRLMRIRQPSARSQRISGPIDLMDDLANFMLEKHKDDDSILRHFFLQAKKSSLAIDDYAHVKHDVRLIVGFLGNSIESCIPGVNVMIYGPPGTGKTELARLLASELDVSFYEIKVERRDGAPLPPQGRMGSYLMCQRMLSIKRRSLVLFDEIEDIFSDTNAFAPGYDSHHSFEKGFRNRLLEENPVPSIWISNSLRNIDPAILRRFDYVLKLGIPPRHVRRSIFQKHLNGLQVGEHWLDRIVANEHITPADTERAAKVVRISGLNDRAELEGALERVFDSVLKTRGHHVKQRDYKIDAPDYDLDYLNPSCNLRVLIESIGRRPRGNICLYGPPGTGKTAFAYHMAEALGKELIHKRASDILSMWVGGTEANIAKMFATTDVEREILLLDEADSFFQDRRSAVRSWEITQVNELLVQMESFEGLFVCATNLMEGLDQAMFRRFAVKIKFDFLKTNQRWNMFMSTLILLDSEDLNENLDKARRRLDQLSRLTPGDFAAVRKRMALLQRLPSPEDIVGALEEECSFKPDAAKHKLGFG